MLWELAVREAGRATMVPTVAFITAGTAQVQSTYERAKVREIYRSSTGIKNENDETSLAAQKI